MTRMDRIRAMLPTAALLSGLAFGGASGASIGTAENTQFVPLWMASPQGIGVEDAPALLNMPPGWATGDAAVVLAPGGDWPPGQRDRLVSLLLDSGAAVLELNPPRPGGPAAEAGMAAALGSLREGFGAGVVVAIGHGTAGEAAMTPGAWAVSDREGGYAAAVRIGPGAPFFLFGTAPRAESWPQRAWLFCDLLALAQPATAPDIIGPCQAGLARLQ